MAFERRVILILLLLVGVSLFERQGFDLAKRTRARADEVPPNFHFSSRPRVSASRPSCELCCTATSTPPTPRLPS